MSKLDELIAELCPDGVEYVKLGDVIKLEKGKQLNKEFLTEQGKYPAYNGGVTHSGFTDKYNYDENKIIISQGGASAGFVNFVKTKFWANAHCYVVLPIEHYINNRYAYHFIKSKQTKLMDKQHGAGIPALRSSEINNLKIPLPPLPVQQEIVRILDNFTELTAELTAELEARTKQYEYYRNKLLDFSTGSVGVPRIDKMLAEMCPNGVPFKQLWEVTAWDKKFNAVDRRKQARVVDYHYFLAGDLKNIVKEDGDVKILTTNISNLYTKEEYVKGFISEGEIVCLPWGGNPVIQYFKGKFVTADNRIATSLNTDILLNKFLYYVLINKLDLIASFYRGSGIKHPDMSKVLDIIIPVPPIEVQREIVRILDNFSEYVTSISQGLPAEIELRRKQYEYYRDKLLTFKKLEV